MPAARRDVLQLRNRTAAALCGLRARGRSGCRRRMARPNLRSRELSGRESNDNSIRRKLSWEQGVNKRLFPSPMGFAAAGCDALRAIWLSALCKFRVRGPHRRLCPACGRRPAIDSACNPSRGLAAPRLRDEPPLRRFRRGQAEFYPIDIAHWHSRDDAAITLQKKAAASSVFDCSR